MHYGLDDRGAFSADCLAHRNEPARTGISANLMRVHRDWCHRNVGTKSVTSESLAALLCGESQEYRQFNCIIY